MVENPADTCLPFIAAFCVMTLQVIRSAACMCVEEEKRLRLFQQMIQHRQQDDVLVNIGKIAGVKGVTVVQ